MKAFCLSPWIGRAPLQWGRTYLGEKGQKKYFLGLMNYLKGKRKRQGRNNLASVDKLPHLTFKGCTIRHSLTHRSITPSYSPSLSPIFFLVHKDTRSIRLGSIPMTLFYLCTSVMILSPKRVTFWDAEAWGFNLKTLGVPNLPTIQVKGHATHRRVARVPQEWLRKDAVPQSCLESHDCIWWGWVKSNPTKAKAVMSYPGFSQHWESVLEDTSWQCVVSCIA